MVFVRLTTKRGSVYRPSSPQKFIFLNNYFCIVYIWNMWFVESSYFSENNHFKSVPRGSVQILNLTRTQWYWKHFFPSILAPGPTSFPNPLFRKFWRYWILVVMLQFSWCVTFVTSVTTGSNSVSCQMCYPHPTQRQPLPQQLADTITWFPTICTVRQTPCLPY